MSYDQELARRIRRQLANDCRMAERHMFGGIAWLEQGHMVCGIVGTALMLRIGEEASEAALQQAFVRPMDFTGRTLRGYVYVDPPALDDDVDLGLWIAAARDFVEQLPPKPVRKVHDPDDDYRRVA